MCVCVGRMCVFRYSVRVCYSCAVSANTAICSQMYVELSSFRLHRNQCSTAMAKLGIHAPICYKHPKKKTNKIYLTCSQLYTCTMERM